MEDFYYAGGVPALLKELDSFLHTACKTANGKTIQENYQNAKCYNRDVIASIDKPFNNTTALAVLYGNICLVERAARPVAHTHKSLWHGPAL